MACGEWSVSQVVDLINRFRESSAQFIVDGRPLVSTFEGPGWAENWISVREQTDDIFLVPDWSSLGPYGISEKLDVIDGACKPCCAGFIPLMSANSIPVSWDAWPKAGQNQMNINEDLLYCDNLKGKKYMMGVSPYFYTSESCASSIVVTRKLIKQTCRNGTRTGTAQARVCGMIDGNKYLMYCLTLFRSSHVSFTQGPRRAIADFGFQRE